MAVIPTVAPPRCPRCRSKLTYEGRPCHVCISPAIYTLREGTPVDICGLMRAEDVRLPEFALPAAIRGKNVIAPRGERAIAVMRQVGRWTWNSLGIAACVHLIAVITAMFMTANIQRVEDFIQSVQIDETVAAAPVAAPEPDELQVPAVDDNDFDLVMPDMIMEDPEILAGDPELEAPDERLFAPEELVAPPTPTPPRPHAFLRPDADHGLGGGQPNPSKATPPGSGLFKNREGDSKEAAIKEYGGGADTEDAVNLGLEYLAKKQLSTGSWDPNDGFVNRPQWATSDNGYRGAITALCTLPFLAAGNSPEEGRYEKNVRRAIDWLMQQQTSDGCIAYKNMSQMYTHTVATLALCEAYGLCGNEEIGDAAERAVRFLERSQGAGGGWDYTGYVSSSEKTGWERNDLSITGWGVLAFKSARAVGIRVNARSWDALANLYDNYSLENGETYYADRNYGDLDATRKGIGMVGVGLAARVVLDPEKFAARNYAAERLLLKNAPDFERFSDPSYGANEPNFNTFYGWYYGTLGMFLLNKGKGPAWEEWNTALKKQLLENQNLAGSRKGSWAAADSWIGPIMGDLYSTALAVLCLEVYYRYSPLHRPAEDITEVPERKPRDTGMPPPAVRGDDTPKPTNGIIYNGEEFDLDKAGHRSKYIRALARDKGLGAVPVLIKHLEDESASVRSTALNELGRLKAKDAVGTVQAMLNDPDDEPIQLTVISTLASLGERSVHPCLIKLLSNSDETVSAAAESALSKLSGGKDFGTNKRAWEDWFTRNP
jgi:hypothetical protein